MARLLKNVYLKHLFYVESRLSIQTADTVQSSVVSVQNTAPVLSGIAAEPELVKLGTVITVTSTGASDPDGDPLAVRCGTSSGSSDLGTGSYGAGERTLAFGAPWTDDGIHTIWCVVTDGGLASVEYSTTVTADNTLPVVSLSAPQGGAVWQGGLEYSIVWSATDLYLNTHPITLSYSVDGGAAWTIIAGGIANGGIYSWTPLITSTTQAHVRVQATDQVGNVGLAVSSAFSLDTPPDAPHDPDPSIGATDVPTDTFLSWSCGDANGDTLLYDIYLGTGTNPPLETSSWSGTNYDPGPLQPGQIYYWRIVASDGILEQQGALWYLTTTAEPEKSYIYLPVVIRQSP